MLRIHDRVLGDWEDVFVVWIFEFSGLPIHGGPTERNTKAFDLISLPFVQWVERGGGEVVVSGE